jgi:hypothetical protein
VGKLLVFRVFQGICEVLRGPLVIAEDVMYGAIGFDDDGSEVMADGAGFAEEEEAELAAKLLDGCAVPGGEGPMVGLATVSRGVIEQVLRGIEVRVEGDGEQLIICVRRVLEDTVSFGEVV